VRLDTNVFGPVFGRTRYFIGTIRLQPLDLLKPQALATFQSLEILWSSTCLTPFQTLDRNRAAGEEEDI